MIDEVVIGLRAHEAIAEARLADADLALVALRAGHADHRHVDLLHVGGGGGCAVCAVANGHADQSVVMLVGAAVPNLQRRNANDSNVNFVLR